MPLETGTQLPASPSGNTPATSTQETAPSPSWESVKFHGRGGEYFRIWIVNLVLTLLTLGIYSAWATIRNRRYFYGNTEVAGGRLDFHGKALQILFGRIIALVLLIGWSQGALISPFVPFAAIAIVMGLLPWFLVRALSFRLRQTSLRNLRFGFGANAKQAYKALWPYLAALFLVFSGFVYISNQMLEVSEDLEERAEEYAKAENHDEQTCADQTRVEEPLVKEACNRGADPSSHPVEENETAATTTEELLAELEASKQNKVHDITTQKSQDILADKHDSLSAKIGGGTAATTKNGASTHTDTHTNTTDYSGTEESTHYEDETSQSDGNEGEGEEQSFFEAFQEAMEESEAQQTPEMQVFQRLMGFYMLLLMAMAFVFPVFICDVRRFNTNNSQYGSSVFSVELKRTKFFEHFWVAIGISMAAGVAVVLAALIIAGIVAGIVIGLDITLEGDTSIVAVGAFIAAFIGVYALMIISYMAAFAYWRGRIFNDTFNSLKLGGITFRSRLKITRYAKLWVVNTLLMIISLGFAYPWVKIRLLRYQLESIDYSGDTESFLAHNQSDTDAVGDEVGEAFDFDFGF